jgi:HEAT repeat protein
VRFEAVRSLGNIKDPRAIEPLRDATNDRDEAVRDIALDVLEKITGKRERRIQDDW